MTNSKGVRAVKVCRKCLNTGWYQYDNNHSQVCPDCCKHDKGFWELKEFYGKDNGRLCCKAGCGYLLPVRRKRR